MDEAEKTSVYEEQPNIDTKGAWEMFDMAIRPSSAKQKLSIIRTDNGLDRPPRAGPEGYDAEEWQVAEGWQKEKGMARYLIEAKTIGRGGMSEVYRAWDRKLKRRVAIKFLHSYLLDEEDWINRLELEAKTMARIRHPNVVEVYDFIKADIADENAPKQYKGQEIAAIIIEEIDTEKMLTLKRTLDDLDSKGEYLEPQNAAEIIKKMAIVVEDMDKQGIRHCDLKPGNIFVNPEDPNSLKISDFGLAPWTRVGFVEGAPMGTPAYMSPEHAQGIEITSQSDVFSLGIIAYKMLTGRVPWKGSSQFETVMMVVDDPFAPPSKIRPFLPKEIDKVFLKALAKDPSIRHQTPIEFTEALEKALSPVLG